MHLNCRPSPSVRVIPADQIQRTILAAYDGIHSDVSRSRHKINKTVNNNPPLPVIS